MRVLAAVAFVSMVGAGVVLGCSSGGASNDSCANHNDSRCPATYATSLGGQACAPIGLTCVYIGSGNGSSPPGCPGAARLACHGDGGALDTDGGAEAGPGVWMFFQ